MQVAAFVGTLCAECSQGVIAAMREQKEAKESTADAGGGNASAGGGAVGGGGDGDGDGAAAREAAAREAAEGEEEGGGRPAGEAALQAVVGRVLSFEGSLLEMFAAYHPHNLP